MSLLPFRAIDFAGVVNSSASDIKFQYAQGGNQEKIRRIMFQRSTKNLQSQGSSVCITAKLRAGRPWFDSRQRQDYSLLRRVQTGYRAHPGSYKMFTGGSSPRGELARASSLPLTSIQCRGQPCRIYTSTLPTSLHGI